MVLPYISMNPPQEYMCSLSWIPLPPPSPYQPSGSSQCTSPEHPVSCIEPGLAIHLTYDNIYVSMPFSLTIPPSPSPTESKRQGTTFRDSLWLQGGDAGHNLPVASASPGQFWVEGRGHKLSAAHPHRSWRTATSSWGYHHGQGGEFRLHVTNCPKPSGRKHLFP